MNLLAIKAQSFEKSEWSPCFFVMGTSRWQLTCFRCYENINYLIKMFAPFPDGEGGILEAGLDDEW